MNIQEIIDEINDGNKDLFRVIAKEYYHQIYVYVYKQILNQDEAFDITQDVFVKIYQNLHQYDQNKASFKNWIYHIASNCCVDYFRSKAFKLRSLTTKMDDDIPSYDNILDDLTNQETIQHVLYIMNHKLKVKHQKIVQLYFFSDLEPKEIATLLNIPVKTIYSVVDLSLKKIKKELEVNL